MTFVLEWRSCSRKQRVKTFSATLEAEYAGSVAAGTIEIFEPVLPVPRILAKSHEFDRSPLTI